MLRNLLRSTAVRQLRNGLFQSPPAAKATSEAVAAPVMVARHFSTAKDQDIQPPKTLFSVPGRYASALFVAAAKASALDTVEKELKNVVELAKSNPDFDDFLRDPTTATDLKLNGIKELFKSMDVSEITTNFFMVLAENGRLNTLPKLFDSFEELIMAHKGEVKAVITAAMPLTDSELKEMTEVLSEKWIAKNQTLKVEQKVDRSIVGGVIIDIGEKHIDLSIDTRIKKMEALLAQAL